MASTTAHSAVMATGQQAALRSSPGPSAGVLPIPERRRETRLATAGALWLIDGPSNTLVRCECVDLSADGLRLRAPLGFGIRAGQRYELSSHRPGQTAAPGFDLNLSRSVTVVRADVRVADGQHSLDVGVRLESPIIRHESIGSGESGQLGLA